MHSSDITYAKSLNLRPGIALSATQLAQLTSDMVWLVEQTVTLADGSKQAVLVPQVYVRVRPGDLDGSGALLAGKDIKLNLTGDLSNSGTIAGRQVLSITADNINNLGGTLSAEQLSANARQDLSNIGGLIEAGGAAALLAGRDLNLRTSTQTSVNVTPNAAGGNTFAQTGIDRVAGLYVKSGTGTLVASAGRDLTHPSRWEAAPAAEGWFGAEAGIKCWWSFNPSRTGALLPQGRACCLNFVGGRPCGRRVV